MIYFIEYGNLIKIGYAKNPAKRIKEIQSNYPLPLGIVGIIDGERSEEQKLHFKFKEYHVNKEWFEKSISILNFVKEKQIQYKVDILNFRKSFDTLKGYRVRMGYALRDMAIEMNMKIPSVQAIEIGFENNSVNLSTLKKYLDVLGLTIKIVEKE